MRSDKELLLASKEFSSDVLWKSWSHLSITIIMIVLVFSGILTLDIPLWIRLFGAVICGLLYVRLFVIYHDFMHRAILTESKLADRIMTLVGIFLLAPKTIWKRSHEHHHNNNSKLSMTGIGSYPLISKDRYLTLTKKEKFIYLVNRNAFTIFFGYFTLFVYWLNVKSFINSPSKHIDSLLALLLHIGGSFTVWHYLGLEVYFVAWFFPFLLAFGMGSYLFYCQHNFPGAKFKENQEWSYVGAALHSTSLMQMNPVMHWFTANIGFHPVHHVNSRIPFYKLKEAMESMPELSNAPITSWAISDVINCLRLKLWDPELDRMIRLDEIGSSIERQKVTQ